MQVIMTSGDNFKAQDNNYIITGNVFYNNTATMAIFNLATNTYIKGLHMARSHYKKMSIEARINTIMATL